MVRVRGLGYLVFHRYGRILLCVVQLDLAGYQSVSSSFEQCGTKRGTLVQDAVELEAWNQSFWISDCVGHIDFCL